MDGVQAYGWCTGIWMVYRHMDGVQVFGWCRAYRYDVGSDSVWEELICSCNIVARW